MSQIAKTITGLAIAAVLSSPAVAQGVVTRRSISLPMAQTIANAVIAKCRSMGFKISVSVLDHGGLALVMLRDPASTQSKAAIARLTRRLLAACRSRSATT